MSTYNTSLMEEYWKLTFNYHQIPTLSVILLIFPEN